MIMIDRLLWVWLYRLWPRCLDTMVFVKPATVGQWLCLPKTLSRMTGLWACVKEAGDGHVSGPAAACYPVVVRATGSVLKVQQKSREAGGHGMRVMETVIESFGEDAHHDQERT